MEHTITQWKALARLLKTVYLEIEKEAIDKGIDILSPEYDELISNARLLVLEKNGWTLEEYRSLKEQIEGIDKAGTLEVMKDTQKKVKAMGERIDDFHIPTSEEISQIAEQVAQKYIVPPQITNQIVERIIEKRPIKETIKIKERVEYDDKPIRKEIKRVLQQIDEIKIPEQISIEKLKKELKSDFSVFFEHNINTLDMPNFRKLAMGLQGQIDDLANNPSSSVGAFTDLSAGTGISYNNLTGVITNSAPDQTVALTAGTNITSITGTYPNFTVNAATQTTDITGKLSLTGGTMTGGLVLVAGTTTVQPIKMVAGTNLTVAVSGVFEFDGSNLFFSIA